MFIKYEAEVSSRVGGGERRVVMKAAFSATELAKTD